MGTRGLVCYVHKGQRYVRYNHWDSYPSGLGLDLLGAIPTDPEAFQKWLEETRSFLENVTTEVDDDEWDLKELSRFAYPFANYPVGGIEWTYVHDLDRLSFSVDYEVHFRLDNLPPADEWLSYIALDGGDQDLLCITPRTPEQYRGEYVAFPYRSLSDTEIERKHFYDSRASDIRKIHPSTWLKPVSPNLANHEKLALLAAEGFIESRYSLLTNVHRSHYPADSFCFDDLAMDVLTAACHGGSTFTFDKDTAFRWTRDVFDKSQPVDASDRKRHDYYWFRGCLVSLAESLDREDHFKMEVAHVLKDFEGASKPFTAILWSIRHVAVLVMAEDGISLSDPIPVAAALGKNDENMYEGLKLIMHYLPMPVMESGNSPTCHLPFDIILRIIDFLDPETDDAFGKTSKAFRWELAKRPFFGSFRIISESREKMCFSTLDEVGRPVTLRLAPYGFKDNNDDHSGHGEEHMVAYRKPIHFVNNFRRDDDEYGRLRIANFFFTHGFRVFVHQA
ncbi:hypothetical protein SCHPADRAFT_927242 [Schizopora paradoxa]|uniref:F-box domain-containing protein n=1 Tax=Schizopora paradoxa TaxID=27342 RepID=A0A0H2RTH5_9AGAM|nr:hypothetical protein SCHPADRAFT_927242 [Schizopora paradoxa]